ncbi:hypothetical protein ACLB1S_08035 [Escherichia coli]
MFGDTVYDNLIFPGRSVTSSLTRPFFSIFVFLRTLRFAGQHLTKNIRQLSGGEKQRISLIRNLQFMPKVLYAR